MDDFNKELKGRINKVLKEHNLSRNQLSVGSGLSQTAVNNQTSDGVKQTNKAKVSLELVMHVLDTFPDVSADWLLRGKEPATMENVVAGDQNIANNQNSTINGMEVIRSLTDQLAEKDKQINRLIEILARQPQG